MNRLKNEAGAVPENPAPPASGQNVHKFRQESKEARPSERLREKPGGAPVRGKPTGGSHSKAAGPAPEKGNGQDEPQDAPAPSEPTSGQNVQKPRPSDRLREKPGGPSRGESSGASAPDSGGPDAGDHTPPPRPDRDAEKLNQSKRRMERSGEKLNAAKEKLAAQKPPKKPGAIKRMGGVVKGEAWMFVHGKIYQVEDENVGTEAAHRSELTGEAAVRGVTRFVKKQIRTHPARAVRKAESKNFKATADYQFRKATQEHPELKQNIWKRHRLKKQYQKQAREAAKQSAKTAGKTAAKGGRAVVGFVKRHPAGVLIALCCVLLVFMLQSCASSLVTVGNGIIGAVGASTFPSEDIDMQKAEAAYLGLEEELQKYLDEYERNHDYDEYHFNLAEIGAVG